MTRLLSEAEERARSLLGENLPALDAVVALLLERETISGHDLAEVVGKSKLGTSSQKGPAQVSLANGHRR